MLRDGRLHLSGIAQLAPLLTADNRDALLARATHLSKRQIEQLVASLWPRPDVPSVIRKLPQKRLRPSLPAAQEPSLAPGAELFPGRVAAQSATSPPNELVARRVVAQPTPQVLPTLPPPPAPAVVEALAPARFKVQFTASAELRDKLERLTALLRSEVPGGDLAAVIDRAVSDKLERLEARRFGKTATPRKMPTATDTSAVSRHIPAAVRRVVRDRDGERCRFVDAQGRRCSERNRLEFHHRHPFAMGGDHRPDNIGLLCPQHNRSMAERRAAILRHVTTESASPRPSPGSA